MNLNHPQIKPGKLTERDVTKADTIYGYVLAVVLGIAGAALLIHWAMS